MNSLFNNREKQSIKLRVLILLPLLGGNDSITPQTRSCQSRLSEASGLASAISLEVIKADFIRIRSPNPATLVGTGKLSQIKDQISENNIQLLILDGSLTPIQQRNLERTLEIKVIDRTALILEIFGARARTREGTLQVELASLTYQRSRLVRSWTHLERQRGGGGFLGGPGETQIEADRRQIDDRIKKIKKLLHHVTKTRKLQRDSRRRVPYPIVAFVGYTNAGKSTLFNLLTGANVSVEDQVFATLDPTMRAINLPSGQKVILSDTVGFISDLPHDLISAFHATLEEVLEADLLLHVRDISHVDFESQYNDVIDVLESLGGIEKRLHSNEIIEVYNKVDVLFSDESKNLNRISPNQNKSEPLMISAKTGEGIRSLINEIELRLQPNTKIITIKASRSDGATQAWLYRHGDVLDTHNDDEFTLMKVRLSNIYAARAKMEINAQIISSEQSILRNTDKDGTFEKKSLS